MGSLSEGIVDEVVEAARNGGKGVLALAKVVGPHFKEIAGGGKGRKTAWWAKDGVRILKNKRGSNGVGRR